MRFEEWLHSLNDQRRDPATLEKAQWFAHDHLPADLRGISQMVFHTAVAMTDRLPDGPQLTLGLQHLIEAKDCFVRQASTIIRVGGQQ